jgi:hypothetical protein
MAEEEAPEREFMCEIPSVEIFCFATQNARRKTRGIVAGLGKRSVCSFWSMILFHLSQQSDLKAWLSGVTNRMLFSLTHDFPTFLFLFIFHFTIAATGNDNE